MKKHVEQTIQKQIDAAVEQWCSPEAIEDIVCDHVDTIVRDAVLALLGVNGSYVREGSPLLSYLKPRILQYAEEIAANIEIKLTRAQEKSLREEIVKDISDELYTLLRDRSTDCNSPFVAQIDARMEAIIQRMLDKELGGEK